MQWMSCNCGNKIGYDEDPWTGTVTPHSVANVEIPDLVINIKDDISKLEECKYVFCGNRMLGGGGECGKAVRFAEADWPAIRTWIEEGGRLFMVSEWWDSESNKCEFDADLLDQFLVDVTDLGIAYNRGEYSPGITNPMVGGPALIGAGLPTTNGNTFAQLISTGTPGCQPILTATLGTGAGKTVMAVERIQDGFYFLSGDSNIGFGGSEAGLAELYRRIFEFENDEII